MGASLPDEKAADHCRMRAGTDTECLQSRLTDRQRDEGSNGEESFAPLCEPIDIFCVQPKKINKFEN